MDRAALIAAYSAIEARLREHVPGPFLDENDYRACIEEAARQCGVSVAEASEELGRFWAMSGSG